MCDNNGARALAQNPIFHARTKNIEIDVHLQREKLADGSMEINYVNSTDQVVDLLTKPMTTARHSELTRKLNLCSQQNLILREDERISTDVLGLKQCTC